MNLHEKSNKTSDYMASGDTRQIKIVVQPALAPCGCWTQPINMHYKNGREAKPGDKVVNLTTSESGILYDLNAQSDTCNGRVAP
jgi:hypothetical protein